MDMIPTPQPLPQLEKLMRAFLELECVKEYMLQKFSGD